MRLQLIGIMVCIAIAGTYAQAETGTTPAPPTGDSGNCGIATCALGKECSYDGSNKCVCASDWGCEEPGEESVCANIDGTPKTYTSRCQFHKAKCLCDSGAKSGDDCGTDVYIKYFTSCEMVTNAASQCSLESAPDFYRSLLSTFGNMIDIKVNQDTVDGDLSDMELYQTLPEEVQKEAANLRSGSGGRSDYAVAKWWYCYLIGRGGTGTDMTGKHLAKLTRIYMPGAICMESYMKKCLTFDNWANKCFKVTPSDDDKDDALYSNICKA